MTDYDTQSLIGRKRVGLWYRILWLYPRICGHLCGRVVDTGCGISDMVRYRLGTVGVEVNPKAVASCRNQGLNVGLTQADRLPLPGGEFDCAVLDDDVGNSDHKRHYPEEALVRRLDTAGLSG